MDYTAEIPDVCKTCSLHTCGKCPYANEYMLRTHGYSLTELFNPDSEINRQMEFEYSRK